MKKSIPVILVAGALAISIVTSSCGALEARPAANTVPSATSMEVSNSVTVMGTTEVERLEEMQRSTQMLVNQYWMNGIAVPDYLNDQEQYDQRRQQPDESVVWHALRLTNKTAIPWTTAPAETVTGGQVLGQDVIAYTPVGGESTLKITVAVDVKADQAEFERDRQRDALSFRGWSYDRVTVDGKLSVHNLKPDTVTIETTKLLSGEVQSTEPQATIDKLAGGLRSVNPQCRLRWKVTLEPGKEQQITYSYKVLVRR